MSEIEMNNSTTRFTKSQLFEFETKRLGAGLLGRFVGAEKTNVTLNVSGFVCIALTISIIIIALFRDQEMAMLYASAVLPVIMAIIGFYFGKHSS